MDKIRELQETKIHELYEFLDNLMGNLNEFKNFDKNSLSNFIDKLRLMNKTIDYLKDEIIGLLGDLKNNGCNLDDKLVERLQEEEETSQMIQEIAPLVLYYQLNRLGNINEPDQITNEFNTINENNSINDVNIDQ